MKILKLFLPIVLWVLTFSVVQAQTQTVMGTVKTTEGEALPGVTVVVEGTNQGTVTDLDGKFSIDVAEGTQLQFSFIGFEDVTLPANAAAEMMVVLKTDTEVLEEVVVVGYGTQRKASVVGAISQATGKDLEKSLAGSNLTNSLTGLLPGLVTLQSTGIPGGSVNKGADMDVTQILIRGKSTWNNSGALVLVDGVERSMNDIDAKEIASVSVLKDGAATAVYGVKGGNGVILITTKRGRIGKPKISFEASVSANSISKIPQVKDSYTANKYKNYAIEHGIAADNSLWKDYIPEPLLEYYRTQEYPELYPDVDWVDVMTNRFGYSQKYNMTISGGTKFVKYFSSVSYLHEGDILATEDVGQGYDPDFKYDRINFRNNFDFSLTQTTNLSVNLSAYYGFVQFADGNQAFWDALYSMPPDAFPVKYSDGMYAESGTENPYYLLNFGGYNRKNRSEVNTDFILDQDLSFVLKGLSFNGRVSYDNYGTTEGVTVGEAGGGRATKYIHPRILETNDSVTDVIINYPSGYLNKSHGFEYVYEPLKTYNDEQAQKQARRRLYYEARLYFERDFGKHAVTALALHNRSELARAGFNKNFPARDLGYVYRATYNYDKRYILETNGAYNGTEKFGPEYRMDFFPSVSLGWMVSNEHFFKNNIGFMNHFKIRGSYGTIGDSDGANNHAYLTTWDLATGNNAKVQFGYPVLTGAYSKYTESQLGNPFIHWEVVTKQNIGFETGFFNNTIVVNADFFKEQRDDVIVQGKNRVQNDVFGTNLPDANVGEAENYGYELELKLRRNFGPLQLWLNSSYTGNKDKILFKEDPDLRPDYQKQAGYAIGQPRTLINSGIIQSWDDYYTYPMPDSRSQILPGDFAQIDFDGNGFIDDNDKAPYKYPARPQHTYNLQLGLRYKGFTAMAQFYGVYNVNRTINLTEFDSDFSTVYDVQVNDSYLPEQNRTSNADYAHVRYGYTPEYGDFWLVDGSYIRLKNAEVAYTIPEKYLAPLKLKTLRVYISGNNLWLKTKMAEDRETGNFDKKNYPVKKRYNAGMSINF